MEKRYRIKKKTFADGLILYTPQKRTLMIWWDCYRMHMSGAKIIRNFGRKEDAEGYIRDDIACIKSDYLIKTEII